LRVGQALLGSGRRNHDERQVLVDLHRRQRLPAVEVADHGEHTVAGVDGLLDLGGAAHGHVTVRLVVERAHHDAIAEQPAGVVDLRRRQAHAAQDRLAAVGLEAAERHGDVHHHIAAIGGAASAARRHHERRQQKYRQQESFAHHLFHLL
jgi:hypothetical protein